MQLEIERPYIVYSLSSSRVSQKMRGRKIPESINNIREFLDTVTTAKVMEPDEIRIEVFSPFDLKKLDPALRTLLDQSEPMDRKGVWNVGRENLMPTLNYFESVQSTLKTNYDRHLYLSYSFKLIDPKDRFILEGQQFNSLFSAYLAKTPICLPTLFFPFEEATQNFWNYIDAIKEYLPFELEEKYLRLARIKNKLLSSFKKVERL